MNTLEQALETALKLSFDQQEMLIKILQNRHWESRRAEIAADAQQTLADFRTDKFQRQSAEDVIATLRQSLQEPEAWGYWFQPQSSTEPSANLWDETLIFSNALKKLCDKWK